MDYGKFINKGNEYQVDTPYTPSSWENYLFNNKYHMTVNQTLQGNSSTLEPEPYHRVFTRGYRHFYIKDNINNTIWTPNIRPLNSQTDEFKVIHGLGSTKLISVTNDIRTEIEVFVPLDLAAEVWTIKIKNLSKRKRSLSLFSVLPFEHNSIMGSLCKYNESEGYFTSRVFPYHVTYDEKEEKDKENIDLFAFSNKEVKSFDCSERRFYGGDDITVYPDSVLGGRCSNTISEGSNPVAAFHHSVDLEAECEESITIVAGCTSHAAEISGIKSQIIGSPGIIQKLKNEVDDYWIDISDSLIIKSPDLNLDYFINYWLKKQVLAQTVCHRLSPLMPIRNELQDAMGVAAFKPELAKEYIFNVLKGQESNGRIQQWHIYKDLGKGYGLANLDHCDGPIWLVIAVIDLINQLGDESILQEKVEYKDNFSGGSVYEHLIKTVEYLSSEKQMGSHGLCLMKDGDWTDPINGPGRLGKGESTWTTMGLKYAVRLLIPVSQLVSDDVRVLKLKSLDKRLYERLNKYAWDGKWYIAGFDDEGIPFGTNSDEYGKIYLNAQTWAIISGTATGNKVEASLKAIEKLDTTAGNILVWPEYQKWDSRVGKISIKLPGTTENGAVYCHGSLFKSYADTIRKDGNSAIKTILKTLPTNSDNPPDKNLQLPIFIPNYYFGLKESPNYGISSQHFHTGTVTWILWVVVEQIFGIKSSVNGFLIDPVLPDYWDYCYIEKLHNNCRYKISISQDKTRNENVVIYINGNKHKNNLIPYQNSDCVEIEVIVGDKNG